MNKDCSKQERLEDLVRRFAALNQKNPTETRHMKRLYRSIRDLCLVDAYTLPSIRKLISEDELSGFILKLDSDMRAILLGYDSEKASFRPYFRKIIAYKALSYLTEKVKMERKEMVALKEHMNETYEDKWRIDWENQLHDDKLFGIGNQRAIQALRHLCSERPSFQKRVFIFICTILPSIPSNMLEKLCANLGFDFMQTLMVNESIHEEILNTSRVSDKDLYIRKRNANWSWMLYYQSQFASEGANAPDEFEKEVLSGRIEMYKKRLEGANGRIGKCRSNVEYQVVGKVLGIPNGTVSSSVFTVKNVMEAVLLEEKGFELAPKGAKGLLSMIEESEKTKSETPPLFKPCETFRMKSPNAKCKR